MDRLLRQELLRNATPAKMNARPFTITPDTKKVLVHIAWAAFGFGIFYAVFFSPVLFSNRVLAPGDGISYFLPAYYRRILLWDVSIWGGFPAVGDAPRMLWYPPALLLSLIPHAWNLFIISSYVLASSFTYGYVFSVTRSRLSAIVSGLIYGLCGFMIAHIGHAAIVHTIAWLPLIAWTISELTSRERVSAFWFTVGAVAVACAALAGHAQMFVYVLLISLALALVQNWKQSRGILRLVWVAIFFSLGTGLASLQLLPTAELTRWSLRAALTFTDFVAYKLPVRQLPTLLFPFVYGGAPDSFYRIPYFGSWPSSADGWGASEVTGYAGLLPLMLAAIGFFCDRRKRLVWFWIVVAVVAVLLALGEATPLGYLTYYLPVLNKFRAPARHLFAFAFAISFLAGLGVNSIQQLTASNTLLKRVVVASALTIAVSLVSLKLFENKIREWASAQAGPVSLNPLRNPALTVPLVIFIASAVALVYWRRRPEQQFRAVLVLAVLVIDLSSFAWFYEWRYRSPYDAYLSAPAAAAIYKRELDASHQRLLPVSGGLGRVSELPPNLSQLWGVPSASGYGPFILTRTSRMLTMPPHGSVDGSWRDAANQNLDLMAVRYLIVPPGEVEPPTTTDERGLLWSVSDFDYVIGPGCDATKPDAVHVDLPKTPHATRLGLVGALACSVALPNGVQFAEVTTTDIRGVERVYGLRAGEHASEWAFDCADVRPAMKHERAEVFRNYQAERGPVKCEAHDYVSFVKLEENQEIKSVDVKWTGPPGTFALKKLTAIDDDAKISRPVHASAGTFDDNSRWRYAGEINASNSGYGAEVKPEHVGTGLVYENLRARPRAWLVSEVISVSGEEAFKAVRSSKLPDGRAFEPARVALVEEKLALSGQSPDENAKARVRLVTSNEMEVETQTSVPGFLVTSDAYFPGWDATVDGVPTQIYQADYALRGVQVPAGAHLIRFEFRPKTFYYGMGLSGLSLLLLILCAWRVRRVELRESVVNERRAQS
ncbi:MAG TPA: YfhO family protein [Pyrinomonadaceae bacterium]|nr:YfhO family protein [Pyrinomonadaceae bacterium]